MKTKNLTSYTWSYGHRLMTRASAAGNLAYVRDALGQTTRVTGPEVTYRYAYDAAHRLASVSDSRGGKTLGYDCGRGGQILQSSILLKLSRQWFLFDSVTKTPAAIQGHGRFG